MPFVDRLSTGDPAILKVFGVRGRFVVLNLTILKGVVWRKFGMSLNLVVCDE